jgi:hypothetical protein
MEFTALLVADEVMDHDQRESEHADCDQGTAKPGLLESGNPAAGAPQVAMRRMGTISMPAHQTTQDQDN